MKSNSKFEGSILSEHCRAKYPMMLKPKKGLVTYYRMWNPCFYNITDAFSSNSELVA